MKLKSPSSYLLVTVCETVQTYGLSALIAAVLILIAQYFVNSNLLYLFFGVYVTAPVLVPVIRKCRNKEKTSPDGKAVFITGCDRGFGHLLAQRLDDIGFLVFAGCLFPEGEGASQLRRSGSTRMHVVSLDVTSDSSVQSAAAYIKENLGDNVLWAVVNNAGILDGADIHWTDMEVIKKISEVNTFGVVRVTKSLLSILKESQGRVITVCSMAGYITLPGIVPYCMSKRAAVAFCDGLRIEMYKWGIQVVTIEPFIYRTPITYKEEIIRKINTTWEKAPKIVKDMYRLGFIEAYVNRYLLIQNMFMNSNSSEVITTMEEAVTSLYPKYHYRPGSFLMRLVGWFMQVAPTPVVDAILFYAVIEKGID